jgi:hypothetical protein
MLTQALEQGAQAFGWSARQDRPCQTRDGDWWVGMGVASAARVNMMVPAQARVTLRADGSALVETDQTDIGTGSYAILGQIAGEMLGLPMARVDVKLGDSALPPALGRAAASARFPPVRRYSTPARKSASGWPRPLAAPPKSWCSRTAPPAMAMPRRARCAMCWAAKT